MADKWILYVGGNVEIGVDARGRMAPTDECVIEMPEEEACEEALRRAKNMNFWLVSSNRMKAIMFNADKGFMAPAVEESRDNQHQK